MEFILANDVDVDGVLWKKGTLCFVWHEQIDEYGRLLWVVGDEQARLGIFKAYSE